MTVLDSQSSEERKGSYWNYSYVSIEYHLTQQAAKIVQHRNYLNSRLLFCITDSQNFHYTEKSIITQPAVLGKHHLLHSQTS